MIGSSFLIEVFQAGHAVVRFLSGAMSLGLLWILLVGCGAFLLGRKVLRNPGQRIILAALALCAVVPVLKPRRWRAADHAPRVVKRTGHVQSKTCRNCHPGAHATWKRSYHRTMAQLASPETVLAPFDGSEHSTWGTRFRFERRGDEFWVHIGTETETAGSPMTMVPHRVVMLTGSHHIQICWLTDGSGQPLIELPIYYSIDHRRWIPKKDSVLSPPDMGPFVGSWNARCSRCHSVAAKPGYDVQNDQFDIEVAEFGIACESCHGPGEVHVRLHQNPVNRYLRRFDEQPDPSIVNPSRCSPQISTQICGRCHSAALDRDFSDYLKHGVRYRAGDDLNESFRILKYEGAASKSDKSSGDPYENAGNVFWNDGTCRVGGDEYNAHIESPCYQGGKQTAEGRPALTCLSCHSMHQKETDTRPASVWANDQLKPGRAGNQACLECHNEPVFQQQRLQEHTHHAAESTGSLCYNCHMPHTTYALFTAMRSHRIDSPRVASGTESDRPNACNLCHVDRTLKWTSDRLAEWYGTPQAELTDDEQQIAASLLWLLRGDAVQRVFAAWHLGWGPAQQASGERWQAPLLAQLLDDPYSIVRFMAHQSLSRLPGFADFEYDFIGSKSQQIEAKRRALVISQQRSRELGGRTLQHVLREPDGTLRQPLIDRLLGERDDRPLSIPE